MLRRCQRRSRLRQSLDAGCHLRRRACASRVCGGVAAIVTGLLPLRRRCWHCGGAAGIVAASLPLQRDSLCRGPGTCLRRGGARSATSDADGGAAMN
eukprot:6211720-Pleurochrysis_carterae.AAC.2